MIEFQGLSQDIHHCTSHQDGDWLVWRCPLCENYERRLNWSSGEMITKGKIQGIRHTGFHSKDSTIAGQLIKNIGESN